jgi:hypothetical protein
MPFGYAVVSTLKAYAVLASSRSVVEVDRLVTTYTSPANPQIADIIAEIFADIIDDMVDFG